MEDEIRQATHADIDHIKRVADRYRQELGFIIRAALVGAVDRGELLYHPPTGSFCHYYTRRDKITVIYEICVPGEARGQGVARKMIEMLPQPIRLKCPVDNTSNGLYEHLGFTLLGQEPGKKRMLNIWQLGF